jgi:NAD(P)-dependent dehydrogenase (short-subunit alcohol dehydrogenase family)
MGSGLSLEGTVGNAARHGKPDEIAGGALYIASDSASFLTGHTLGIDGGMTIV